MREASKSLRRRWCEDATGVFPWRSIFYGRILDVGAGDDPLPFPGCIPFDKQDGDAEKLSTYFEPESFDVVHASQCLEHMHDPAIALEDWLRLVKRGGHLIVTIPDFDLYEKRQFPSRWNGDHKAVFSLWRKGFPGLAGKFYNVPDLLEIIRGVVSGLEIVLCQLVTTNFDWFAPEDRDQTFDETEGVEAWNEFVLKKK